MALLRRRLPGCEAADEGECDLTASRSRWAEAWAILRAGLREVGRTTAEGVEAFKMERSLYSAVLGRPALVALQYVLDRVTPLRLEAVLREALVGVLSSIKKKRVEGRSHAAISVPFLSGTRALRVGIVILFCLQDVCGTPPAPLQPVIVSGPCSLTDGGSCAASPNYPNSYGINEACTISGVPPVELETVAFDVDAWSYYDYDYNGDPMDDCPSDYLTVNGKKYCGTSGPPSGAAPPKPGIAPVELAISCVFSVFFTTNALLDLSADLWALDAPRARLAFLRDWYVFRQWSPIVSPLFLALTLLLPFAVFTLCKGALESICGWRSASRLRHTVDILEAVILVGVILPIGIPAAVSAQEALIAACKGSVTGGVSGGGPLGFFSADTTATLRPGDMSACKASAAELPSPHLLMVALNLLMWACDVLRYSCGGAPAGEEKRD
ncbi:hypothetical protein EMIHUDRAFT_462061 [Emiliania huxleyi CCMP1516]|uniref:Uncharacterized protein n=2 Tax=Emiliania huxleyi TaxID=2903 RepID=A0A0D3KZS2_EMIH1|nr:hypothetical protein EMIHUDRAFT_462061 [Emiliania huxleyi CCMP1516]EOD41257.1 hypothetical protein EMIHUDRAFT_462061 [Emiliania huxleyi CCMP1516]|eukprot:XP_005793686.1 hypothetical protein EMIHUDRAFT_462061 [Emiliania huxleyi CCMP1516]